MNGNFGEYLNNYSDYTHEMNDYMTKCFADGTCQLTRENYQEIMEEMLLRMAECNPTT